MKQNYRQAKRQKELARKARQQEKQTKRATTKGEGEGVAGAESSPGADASSGENAVVTPTAPTDGTGAA